MLFSRFAHTTRIYLNFTRKPFNVYARSHARRYPEWRHCGGKYDISGLAVCKPDADRLPRQSHFQGHARALIPRKINNVRQNLMAIMLHCGETDLGIYLHVLSGNTGRLVT